MTMRLNAKIFITGHTGLIGGALVRALDKRGYRNLILKTNQQLNLTDTQATGIFFAIVKPMPSPTLLVSGCAKPIISSMIPAIYPL